jgi:hypothetical protein
MPRYRSHKEVHALKIASVAAACGDRISGPDEETDGGLIITPADEGYAPFRAPDGWKQRFQSGENDASDLGYYVLYEDLYKSWSPTKAFEDGHTRI